MSELLNTLMVAATDQTKEKEIESLRKAVRILERRIQQLEAHNRSLDALVRRSVNETQRALQVAQNASNEITRLLSRRG